MSATAVTEAPAAVTLAGVSEVYGRGGSAVPALDQVEPGGGARGVTCLIGASGCGKSTLLNLVAGLDQSTSGEISVGGRVALMFQAAGLFPWLTAAGNVELVGARPRRAEGRAQAAGRPSC